MNAMSRHSTPLLLVAALCLWPLVGMGAAPEPAAATPPAAAKTLVSAQADSGLVDVSLAHEVRAAQRRALDWLVARQNPDGSWSNTNYPALTALPLWAFAVSDHPARAAVISNAVKTILACVQPDGGIYRNLPGKGGGLANYNTAIGMVALHLTGDPAFTPVVQRARTFVAASQSLQGDDMYRGGMGYDKATGRTYTDLSDTVVAFEAMRLTQSVEDLRPAAEKRADLDWQAATQFLGRVQNTESSGPEDKGGFAYRPDESKAGTITNAAGVVVLRSYGSMTYAGLLSLIYADVSKDDPRVRSAVDWAMRHWSLRENPGMGDQGLYYFYNIMAKSLGAYGRDRLPVQGAPAPVAWRTELCRTLVQAQKTETDGSGQGYWANANNRFWESDPILVTSYSLIALDIAMGE